MLVYRSCTCCTPSSSWKGPMKEGLSILPSCFLSGGFLGIGSLGFSEFQHGTRKPYQVMCARFFKKTFFAPNNLGNGPKIGFFELKENLVISFP